jgi:hypothetical protein
MLTGYLLSTRQSTTAAVSLMRLLLRRVQIEWQRANEIACAHGIFRFLKRQKEVFRRQKGTQEKHFTCLRGFIIGASLLRFVVFVLGFSSNSIIYPRSWEMVKLLGAFAKLRKATISFVMSVCPPVYLSSWNNSVLIVQIFIKFHISDFSKICRENSSFIKI